MLNEGPEGVKWKLGFGQILVGKMGFGHWEWESQTEKQKNWDWDFENLGK